MSDITKLLDGLQADNPDAYAEAAATVALVEQAAKALRAMRKKKGLSRDDMATALGISPGRISQLESGALRHAPSLKVMARWARACDEQVVVACSSEAPNSRPVSYDSVLVVGGKRRLAHGLWEEWPRRASARGRLNRSTEKLITVVETAQGVTSEVTQHNEQSVEFVEKVRDIEGAIASVVEGLKTGQRTRKELASMLDSLRQQMIDT